MTDLDSLRDRLRSAPPATAGPLPSFDPERAPDAPGPLFAEWLAHALDERVPEPRAMTLGTADADGRSSSRVLVLRGFELADGACAFRFSGDAAGRKAADLAARPYAALTWYWPAMGRQIRAAGPVETLDAAATRADFHGRGEASRTAGFTGRTSAPLSGRAEYERAWSRARARLAAEPDAVPEHHRLYLLRAEEAEFFQLAADGFHRRLRYTRDGSGWQRGQLWP